MHKIVMGCEASQGVKIDESRRSNNTGNTGSLGGSFNKENRTCDSNQKFTDIQIDCIRSTWPLVAKNRISYGSTIFTDIFTIEPRIKELFPFRDLTGRELLNDASFIKHITRFMNALELVCDNLERIHEEDNIASNHLLVLGATHAGIRDFDFRHFNVFIKCTHFTWEQVLGEEYTQDVREAWSILFDFIVEKIQEGFLIYIAEDKHEDG